MNLKKRNLDSHLRLSTQTHRMNASRLFQVVDSDIENLWGYLNKNRGLFEQTFRTYDIDMFKAGLSGLTLFVNPQATSGPLFNTVADRPKTTIEVIEELLSVIGGKLDPDSSLEIAATKTIIGNGLFTGGIASLPESVDARLTKMEANILQVSADIHNVGGVAGDTLNTTTYAVNGDGLQSIDKTIQDKIEELYQLHNGSATPSHTGIGTKLVLASSGVMTILGNSVGYAMPYSGELYDVSSGRFYSPLVNDIRLSNLSAVASSNTITGNSYISILVNGIPRITLNIPPGSTDFLSNDIDTFTVTRGDYIQFRITTEDGNTIALESISVAATELI